MHVGEILPQTPSLCGTSIIPRPNIALYAPSYSSKPLFTVVMQLSDPWTMMSTTACGQQLQCFLAVSSGSVVTDSLKQLDSAGLVFSAQVMANLPDGGVVQVMLAADKCNPSSQPQILNTTYDWHSPRATLSLLTVPTLFNSSFSVLATFLKPVLPFHPSNVAATGATVKR